MHALSLQFLPLIWPPAEYPEYLDPALSPKFRSAENACISMLFNPYGATFLDSSVTVSTSFPADKNFYPFSS